MRDLIPAPVFGSIQNHLRRVGESAVSGWEGSQDEEDSLTGDLGRLLSTRQSVLINVDGRRWRWRVRYKKFRGRGKGAFESRAGADGIIQLEVTPDDTTFFKGVLFQAKKGERLGDGDLREQVQAMENLAAGGSAVVLYSPSGYVAIKGTEYLHPDLSLVGPNTRRMRPLASFLDGFLECDSGLRGMYYEARRKRLLVPTIDGQIKAVPLETRHRISIEVAGS